MNKINFNACIAFVGVLFFAGCGQDFSDLQIVKQYDKYGVQDNNGNLLIKYSYDMIYPFDKNGFAIVNGFDGKYGVIDSKNNVIIDMMYDYIGNFEDGLAIIKLNGKIGYINQYYEIVVKPK